MTAAELGAKVDQVITAMQSAGQRFVDLNDMIRQDEQKLNQLERRESTAQDQQELFAIHREEQTLRLEIQSFARQQEAAKQEQQRAARYLQVARSEMVTTARGLQDKVTEYNNSIATFGQMAAMGGYGAQTAQAKLDSITATRDNYKQTLDDLVAIMERIDTALNGGGALPQKTLVRR